LSDSATFDDVRASSVRLKGLIATTACPRSETLFVPVGGSGLAGGVAVALKTLKPGARVIGVQSEEVPGMRAALSAGERVTVAQALGCFTGGAGGSAFPRPR
jgi:threonine dehydratase